MSENKKYYWLKLKEDFFSQPRIKQLRKIAGGDTYTIIYQKIMLLSIKNSGIIEFQNIEPTLEQELALILDEEVDNIKMVLAFMNTSNLIEKFDNNCYLIPDVIHLIGSHTDAAERMKKMRERNNVTPMLQDVTQREERREKKKELDIELNNNIKEVIDHFNQVTKSKSKGTKEVLANIEFLLKTYSVAEIKKVIDFIANDNWYIENKYVTLSTIFKRTKFNDKFERANCALVANKKASYHTMGDFSDKKSCDDVDY